MTKRNIIYMLNEILYKLSIDDNFDKNTLKYLKDIIDYLAQDKIFLVNEDNLSFELVRDDSKDKYYVMMKEKPAYDQYYLKVGHLLGTFCGMKARPETDNKDACEQYEMDCLKRMLIERFKEALSCNIKESFIQKEINKNNISVEDFEPINFSAHKDGF